MRVAVQRFQVGCVSTIALLSRHFSPVEFPLAWSCSFVPASVTSAPSASAARNALVQTSQNLGRMNVLVGMLTSSVQALDPLFHADLLASAGNLFSGK